MDSNGPVVRRWSQQHGKGWWNVERFKQQAGRERVGGSVQLRRVFAFDRWRAGNGVRGRSRRNGSGAAPRALKFRSRSTRRERGGSFGGSFDIFEAAMCRSCSPRHRPLFPSRHPVRPPLSHVKAAESHGAVASIPSRWQHRLGLAASALRQQRLDLTRHCSRRRQAFLGQSARPGAIPASLQACVGLGVAPGRCLRRRCDVGQLADVPST